jgi:hypothetical protein
VRILKPVEVREGEAQREMKLSLSGYKLTEIDFDRSGRRFDRSCRVRHGAAPTADIARAQPSLFTKDVEMMRANGLHWGGSTTPSSWTNCCLNSEGLRCQRHLLPTRSGCWLVTLGTAGCRCWPALFARPCPTTSCIAQPEASAKLSPLDDEKSATQGVFLHLAAPGYCVSREQQKAHLVAFRRCASSRWFCQVTLSPHCGFGVRLNIPNGGCRLRIFFAVLIMDRVG